MSSKESIELVGINHADLIEEFGECFARSITATFKQGRN
tara:strand:+ start:278 stop:394 length:117 start_codon:yes stop_codon:yes gene_type:complete